MFETRPTYDQASKENKLSMRTRGTRGQNVRMDSCTEFSLHVNQKSSEKKRNIVDYSQKRLERYIDTIDDPQQKMVLYALLHDYIKGDVALAWKRGQPIYFQVTKG